MLKVVFLTTCFFVCHGFYTNPLNTHIRDFLDLRPIDDVSQEKEGEVIEQREQNQTISQTDSEERSSSTEIKEQSNGQIEFEEQEEEEIDIDLKGKSLLCLLCCVFCFYRSIIVRSECPD